MSHVSRYYDKNAQLEWERFDRHPMEFAVTMSAFRDYLPKPPAAVLDVGGGPGRYSIALAALGYDVVLVDLSPCELALAREKARSAGVALRSVVEASATDLSHFDTSSFDVVLLMGPLYHLLHEKEREGAIAEAIRVARAGGMVCATFITRYALFRDVVKHAPEAILEALPRWAEILESGVHRDSDSADGFTDAYFAMPSEVRPTMEASGLETIDLIAVEGVTSQVADAVNKLKGPAWDAWVDLNYRIGHDPHVFGAADHLLYVGRRRE